MTSLREHQDYAGGTETMQVDPAASFGAAASFLPLAAQSACAGTNWDWVPDVEQPVVPAAMQQVCRSCPIRSVCLTTAVANDVEGYWAGTTTADRHQLAEEPVVTVEAAEWLQLLAVTAATIVPACEQATAKHPAELAGYGWYRRGCRCPGCRAGNAARGRQDKARARAKHAAVAA